MRSFSFLICLIFFCDAVYGLSSNIPSSLASAIEYALIHHPNMQHAQFDLEKIEYDLKVEKDKFLPKLFWHNKLFHEKYSYYNDNHYYNQNNQGLTLGPLMHWNFTTGTKITGNIGAELSHNQKDFSRLAVRIQQPLLKNAGKKINQNSLIQTQIQKDILLLTYEADLEELIVQVSTNYFNYAQLILGDRVQLNSLEQARKYLYQVNSLIETGRIAKSEVEQPALHLETQESQQTESRQRLALAYLLLLESMGVIDRTINVELKDSIKKEVQVKSEIDTMLVQFKKYYYQTLGPDFIFVNKEEQLFDCQLKIIEQNKMVAKDELKWNMNVEGYASIREQEKQYGMNLSLDLPLNDKLKRYQSLYHLKIEQDKVSDLRDINNFYFPKKNAFEKQNIDSKFKQLVLADKMKVLSEKSLKTAELKWQAGRATLFELIQLSNQFQQSELELVKMKISVLTTGFDYLKSIGMLSKFWSGQRE